MVVVSVTTVGGRLLPKVPLSSSSSSVVGRDDDARPSTSGLKTTTTQKRRLSSSRCCCCCCCCSCASSSTLVTDAMTSSSFVSSVKMSSSSSSTTTTTRGARGRTMATRVAFGWSPLRSKRASWKKKQSSTTLSKTKTCVPRAKESKDSFQMKEKFSNETKLRSEAQAPFRVARQFLYASCALSATIGFGIATIQLITGLAGAPNAPPFDQSVSNVGVDFACAAAFAFLWKKDEEAKEKQMSRIGREERLGGLKVELTTGKIVRMQSLRGFSRVVLFAGNLEYLENSLEVAERYKDELIKKGVFLVPVPMDDDAATKLNKPDNAKKNERRFRGSAVNVSQKDGWRDWIWEQKKMAKLGDDVGVYVGLRMDGRVRASGKGVAPFDRFAAELPPVDGGWGGVMDGFDGKVGVDN